MGVVFGYSHIFGKNYAFRIDGFLMSDQLAHKWPNSIKYITIVLNDIAIKIIMKMRMVIHE